MREEAFEFVVELGGQSLVMSHDDCRTVYLLDHLRHGVGFAGAGDAKENLVLVTIEYTPRQRRDCGRLVSLRLVIAN